MYEVSENNLETSTDDTVIKCADRTGNKSTRKPRTIVVRFKSFREKTRILQNCRKLKRMQISIYDDYSKETVAIKKKK